MTIDLSVIIVTRNTCQLTCAAIRSVLESQDLLTKEIIVVDNGSTDDTGTLIEREFPSVHYIPSKCNLGFAGANNLGVKSSHGQFVLLLNSDARLKPESLSAAMDYFQAHAQCGVLGAQLLNPDDSRQNSIANFPSLATELLNKSLLRRLWPSRFPGKEHKLKGPTAVESIIGAFFLTRRALWDKIGGFDERYFFFFEETDFCLQVARQGSKVIHLPSLFVYHEQGKSAKQTPAAARIEYWRSRYAYFQKNHGSFTRVSLALFLVARLTIDWLTSGILALFPLPRWKHKRQVQNAILKWHLKGRPANMGLPR